MKKLNFSLNKILFFVIFLVLAFLIIFSFRSCGRSKQEIKTKTEPIIENPYLSKIDSLQRSLVDLQKQLDECNGSKTKKVSVPVKKVMKKRKKSPPVVKEELVVAPVPVPNFEIEIPERGSLKSEVNSPKKENVFKKKISVPKKIEAQKDEPENDDCPTCRTKYGVIEVVY